MEKKSHYAMKMREVKMWFRMCLDWNGFPAKEIQGIKAPQKSSFLIKKSVLGKILSIEKKCWWCLINAPCAKRVKP